MQSFPTQVGVDFLGPHEPVHHQQLGSQLDLSSGAHGSHNSSEGCPFRPATVEAVRGQLEQSQGTPQQPRHDPCYGPQKSLVHVKRGRELAQRPAHDPPVPPLAGPYDFDDVAPGTRP